MCYYITIDWNIYGLGRVIATVTLPTAVTSSLVPRPLPPPVFDHLQYANMEWEGLGDLVNVNTGGFRVDTRGGQCPTVIISFSCQQVLGIMNNIWYTALQTLCPALRWILQEQSMRSFVRHRPPYVYLASLHMTKSPRPYPSIFAYYKRSKTGGGEDRGNEAIVYI